MVVATGFVSVRFGGACGAGRSCRRAGSYRSPRTAGTVRVPPADGIRSRPPSAAPRVFRPAHRRFAAATLAVATVCCAPVPGQEPAGLYEAPAVGPVLPAAPETAWRVRLVPTSVLFKPFIAGVKPTRMGGELLSVAGGRTGNTTIDGTLGARVGIVRWGGAGPDADGWQLDLAAAAFPRLNTDENWDVDATDFRFGVPLSYRSGPTAISFGYDHISTHVGDEYQVRHPKFERVNYSRDALLLGVRRDVTDDLTLYGEVGYAFVRDGGAEPWVFQFGTEWFRELSPGAGGPVAAANVQMREEYDWGGRFTTVAGWQWRNLATGRLLRLAGKYETGKSRYYEFFGEDASAIGAGIFYDF